MQTHEYLITVERFSHRPDWTLGRFFVQGKHVGYTVEDEARAEKVKGETCIPSGIYPLSVRQSPKFSRAYWWDEQAKRLYREARPGRVPHDVIWVQDVPGFEFILWHWGNTDTDTDGCILSGNTIGLVEGREGVLESRLNYEKLYPLVFPLVRAGGQKIEIRNA